jgi:hypothetical protein
MEAHTPAELPDRVYSEENAEEGNTFNIMSEGDNVTSTTRTDFPGFGEDTPHNPTVEQTEGQKQK